MYEAVVAFCKSNVKNLWNNQNSIAITVCALNRANKELHSRRCPQFTLLLYSAVVVPFLSQSQSLKFSLHSIISQRCCTFTLLEDYMLVCLCGIHVVEFQDSFYSRATQTWDHVSEGVLAAFDIVIICMCTV